jgi:hypothetical protein
MSGFDPARERPAVLFANEAFYRAFVDRNYPSMAALWAEQAPVLCLHPGWPALTGRDAVLGSWRRLLDGPALELSFHRPTVHFIGETAFVVCFEQVGRDWLIATNAFVREGGVWRLAFHQAGPTPAPQPVEAGPDDDEPEARPN